LALDDGGQAVLVVVPEELQKLVVADGFGVVVDVDDFGVVSSANARSEGNCSPGGYSQFAVLGVHGGASGVAHPRPEHARVGAEEGVARPEAAHTEGGLLEGDGDLVQQARHRDWTTWRTKSYYFYYYLYYDGYRRSLGQCEKASHPRFCYQYHS
jgi:hypothetical protein